MTREEIERAAREARPVQAPAFGYSIHADIGDRRQLVLQCFVAEDESDDAVTEKLARALRLVDIQRAPYDLEAEMEGFNKVGGTLRLNIDGLPIAEANMKREVAALATKLQEYETQRELEYQDGYSDWIARGGRGKYEPKGARKQKLQVLDIEIGKQKAAIVAKPNDEKQNRDQVMKTIAHFQDDLKKRRVRVNHLHSLLGKPPCTEYEDVEAFKPD